MNCSNYEHAVVIPVLIMGADDMASSELLWIFCELPTGSPQNKLVVMHLNTFILLLHKVTEKPHEKIYSKMSLARLQFRLKTGTYRRHTHTYTHTHIRYMPNLSFFFSILNAVQIRAVLQTESLPSSVDGGPTILPLEAQRFSVTGHT